VTPPTLQLQQVRIARWCCSFWPAGQYIRLKLRSIGLSDYAALEGNQRIGQIRLATERMPCRWLWNITIHLTGGLPMGSSMPACERVATL